MSYNTLSLICAIDSEEEYAIIERDLASMKPIPHIRKLIHPFKGIVAQIDHAKSGSDKLIMQFEEHARRVSELHPLRNMALIEVECFGGKCVSAGKLIKNGILIHEEAADHLAHLKLLKQLSEHVKTWHFEPFTREYFSKKGGIWGQVNGENFMFICIDLFTNYKNDAKFRCEMTENELILEKKEEFFLYLMEPLNECIKILGSVYNDSDEVLSELQEIIQTHILYMNSYVFIELIDREQVITLENLEGTERHEVLYRFKPFNERKFQLDESVTDKQPVTNDENSISIWEKLKYFFIKK